jgi:hypothetical protein
MRTSAPNEDRSFFLLPTMKMASDPPPNADAQSK